MTEAPKPTSEPAAPAVDPAKPPVKEEEKAKLQEDMRKLIEQNTEYENKLKSEIAKELPITSKTAFDTLLVEYVGNKYYKSLESLSKTYKMIRRARRDGNCFYRSYLIQLLEFLSPHHKSTASLAAATKIEEKLTKSKDFLLAAGYETLVFEDSYDLLMREIEKIKKAPLDKFEPLLLEVVSNPDTSNYLLFYLRMLTSAYIKMNAEFFAGFVTADTVEEYCRAEVEHFDHDCDHIQILALTSYMEAGVTIYVPREDGKMETMKFPEGAKEYPVAMLYLPGHYDPIYPE